MNKSLRPSYKHTPLHSMRISDLRAFLTIFTKTILISCCLFGLSVDLSGQINIGIFNHVTPAPSGNKLQIKLKSNNAVVDGFYTEGKFSIRCLSALGINFTVLQSDLGFEQFGAPSVNGPYTYYVFSNVLNAPYIVNWAANTEIDILTLGYSCTGNANVQLIDDAFAATVFGEHYQELDATDQTGSFYQPVAISAAAPMISSSANTPLCAGMLLDLNSSSSGGSGTLSYAWSGPNAYASALANPAPFLATTANNGIFAVTLSDGNACTATANTNVVVYPQPTANISGTTSILAGTSTNLSIHFTGTGPWNYSINGVAQAPTNTTPVVLSVMPPVTTSYTITAISDALCTGIGGSTATITVRSVLIDIGLFNHVAPAPAGKKLKVKIRPATSVTNGIYSEGKFTIRCPSAAGVLFSILNSDYGFEQFGAPITNGGFTYYRFSNVLGGEYIVNWPANSEIDIITLGYDCAAGNTLFEIVNDAFVESIFGEYYQELNAADETGVIYQPGVTSSAIVSVSPSANTPLCAGTMLDLNCTFAGGNAPLTFAWSGPNGFTAAVANPAPFVVTTASNGVFSITVSDDNSCTKNESVTVVVYPQPTAIITGTTSILAGASTNLTIHFTGAGPWNYSINGVAQAPANSTPVVLSVSPTNTSSYTITAITDALCTGVGGSTATVTVRSVLIDIGLFDHIAPMPAGNKLKVKIRPALSVTNGLYSEGKFTLRCPSTAGVVFTVLNSDYGFEQFGTPITNGGFTYYRFSNVLSGEYTVSWAANAEIDVLTLGYDCAVGNTSFEIINDAFVESIFGEYYQELNAADETGNIYQSTVNTNIPTLSLTASNNSPFCAGGLLDLAATGSGGTGILSYAWTGPGGYTSTLADPPSFATSNANNGLYQIIATDENACTVVATTLANLYAAPTLTITQPAAICLSLNLNNVTKNEMPLGGAFSYHASLADAIANTNILMGAQITAAAPGTYGVRYTISPNGCFTTAAITVTGGNCVEVDAKIMLQGPYNVTNNTMEDALRNISTPPLFPLSEPYSQYNSAPYNFAFVHVGGGGGETTTAAVMMNNDPNNAIVDWVFLELRDKNNAALVKATRSALVQRDGDIVDIDGVSPVYFSQSEKDLYYLMVRHRNHLGVLTAVAWDFTLAMPFIDFTLSSTATFGSSSTSARKELEPGVYGLYAGNTNLKKNGLNFQIKYNGGQNDRSEILLLVGPSTPLSTVSGYYLEDVNLNGQVKYNGSQNDRTIILINVGSSTPLNIITQEPPN